MVREPMPVQRIRAREVHIEWGRTTARYELLAEAETIVSCPRRRGGGRTARRCSQSPSQPSVPATVRDSTLVDAYLIPVSPCEPCQHCTSLVCKPSRIGVSEVLRPAAARLLVRSSSVWQRKTRQRKIVGKCFGDKEGPRPLWHRKCCAV
ncbi:hypothetical protein QAD02_024437 [Eretmocerus hayati]|uniref:Uncharacterized protein n=1 Tax=Eretmocerus hayati TaxID=131215 RepID=A0ACC2PYU2_9HYME|nr:hypothetical protein QAD02_024437 [Eretmocerus hayati]